MSKLLDNLEADLKSVLVDYEETRIIPQIHAQIMLENTRQLKRIADSFEKALSSGQVLNVNASVEMLTRP